MCTVVVGIYLAVVGAEVESVDVVDETVAVVVDTGGAVELGGVDEHIAGEVFVVDVDTSVDDGDNNVGITCRDLPCLEEVDVGAGRHSGRPGVVVVPLLGQTRVVERHFAGGFQGSGHAARLSVALLELHGNNSLGDLHTRHVGEYAARLGGRSLFVESDDIPAVEAVARSLLLEFRSVGKHAAQSRGFYLSGGCVEDRHTGEQVA